MVEVVPGITAMQALAAAGRVPLVEAQELLTLVPVTAGLETLARALELSDTVVAYKGGRHLHEVQRLVRERRPDATAVIGVNVGLASNSCRWPSWTPTARPTSPPCWSPPTRTATGGGCDRARTRRSGVRRRRTGASDLITVRGARVIAEADIVIWASSLVDAGIVAGAP